MKKLIVLSLLASSTTFAALQPTLTAIPYPAGGSHHNKIFVTSEHDATVVNTGAESVVFTITYKVCASGMNDCYSSARNNVVVAPFGTWHDHTKIQTSGKFRAPGYYKSYAMTQIDSYDTHQKAETQGNVTVG